ncbi:MAG: cobalamin biosynthesis protein [Aquincola sp.]|nr:cobalamin biosynthesis protein [Aquincola sp.]
MLGLGCERLAEESEMWALVEESLAKANIAEEAIACVASIALKAAEALAGDVQRFTPEQRSRLAQLDQVIERHPHRSRHKPASQRSLGRCAEVTR